MVKKNYLSEKRLKAILKNLRDALQEHEIVILLCFIGNSVLPPYTEIFFTIFDANNAKLS